MHIIIHTHYMAIKVLFCTERVETVFTGATLDGRNNALAIPLVILVQECFIVFAFQYGCSGKRSMVRYIVH